MRIFNRLIVIIASLLMCGFIFVPKTYANIGYRANTTTTISGSTSMTMSVPSYAVGDVLIAAISANADLAGILGITPPSGWTLVQKTDNQTGNLFPTVAMYYHAVSGGEPSTYTWNFSNTSGVGAYGGGWMTSFTGVNTSNPIDASGSQNVAVSSGTTTSYSTPIISTTADNEMLVMAFVGNCTNSGATWSTPISTSVITSDVHGGCSGGSGFYISQAATGAYGAITSVAPASSYGGAAILALKNANTAPVITGGPTIGYGSYGKTGPNNPNWSITFAVSDGEQSGANQITWYLHTGPNRTGTLVTQATTWGNGSSYGFTIPYNAPGLSNGSNPSLYLSAYDGYLYSASNPNFTVSRDDAPPGSPVKRGSGTGASTGWTSSGGSAYAAVSDLVADDDSTYVYATGQYNTQSDTYAAITPALPGGAVIDSVSMTTRARKTSTGTTQQLQNYAYIGTTYYGAGAWTLPDDTSYHNRTDIWVTNPSTGAAWTEAGVNSAQFAFQKMDAVASAIRVTQTYITVSYHVGSATISPDPVTNGSYTVTFTPEDDYSISSNDLSLGIYASQGGVGLVAGSSCTNCATSNSSKTTASFSDPGLGSGANTRYIRLCDKANNCSDRSFTVNATPAPSGVTTNLAPSSTSLVATLQGSANPNNIATTGHFRVFSSNPVNCPSAADDVNGVATGSRVPAISTNDPLITPQDASPHNFSYTTAYGNPYLLTPNTTYWYCAYAKNNNGTTVGGLQSFTTIDGADNACDAPLGGDLTVSSSCSFPISNSVDGVDGGKLILPAGTSLTLNNGQIINRGSGLKLDGGSLTLGGGKTVKTGIYVHDADGDGVLDDGDVKATPTTGYVNRSSFNSTYQYMSKLKSISGTAYDCDNSATTGPTRWTLYPGYVDTDGDGYVSSLTPQMICAGSTFPSNTVTTPQSVVSNIGIGFAHACAISGGSIKCWGWNDAGQLGNGVTGGNSLTAVSVSGITNAIKVVGGKGSNTCALLADSTVKCWGYNNVGQLGNGNTTNSNVPVVVTGLTGVKDITVGGSHACALLFTGKIKCWGYNNVGQLGNGSTTNSSTPVATLGIVNAVSISAGLSHTCAALSDGKVACWGYNDVGQLGIGTSTIGVNNYSSYPIYINGLSGSAVAVAAAKGSSSCALMSNGTIQCWGLNDVGQLGNGNTTNSPLPVTVSGISTATAISGGLSQFCAILTGGTVKCWGWNNAGQLGNNSTTNSSTPVATTNITAAKAIVSGGSQNCVLTTSGTVQCWGYNDQGQVGTGNTSNTLNPTQVTTSVLTSSLVDCDDTIGGKPCVPLSTQTQQISNSQINVSWAANGVPAPTTYTLYWCNRTNVPGCDPITNSTGSTSTGSTSYSHTSLSTGVSMAYKVVATNAVGSSTATAPFLGTTASCTNYTVYPDPDNDGYGGQQSIAGPLSQYCGYYGCVNSTASVQGSYYSWSYNNGGGGSGGPGNTSSLAALDGSYASVTSMPPGYYTGILTANIFGFSIPNYPITGIKVEINKKQSGTGIKDYVVQLVKGGSQVGANYAQKTIEWPSSDTYVTYGGDGDTWGTTWTSSDVNSTNFGIAIQAKNTGGSYPNAYIDHVKITIYYNSANSQTLCLTSLTGYSQNNSDCSPADGAKSTAVNGYGDGDGDGYVGSSALTFCGSLPSGYQAGAGSDCNDNDSTKWQLLTGYADADHDGYTAGGSSQICSGASLPAGSLSSASNPVDCYDKNNQAYPGETTYYTTTRGSIYDTDSAGNSGNSYDYDCSGQGTDSTGATTSSGTYIPVYMGEIWSNFYTCSSMGGISYNVTGSECSYMGLCQNPDLGIVEPCCIGTVSYTCSSTPTCTTLGGSQISISCGQTGFVSQTSNVATSCGGSTTANAYTSYTMACK